MKLKQEITWQHESKKKKKKPENNHDRKSLSPAIQPLGIYPEKIIGQAWKDACACLLMSAAHSREKWGRKRNIWNGKLEKHVVETIETDTAINNARATLSEGGHSDTVALEWAAFLWKTPRLCVHRSSRMETGSSSSWLECEYFSLLCSKRCTPLGISNYFHNDYLWT